MNEQLLTIDEKSFGEGVCNLRARLGISPRCMSELLGVALRTLVRIEDGLTGASIADLRALYFGSDGCARFAASRIH